MDEKEEMNEEIHRLKSKLKQEEDRNVNRYK